MYNTQQIAERIKQRTKSCGYNMKTMLSDLKLGINIISHLAKGQVISSINLACIADYLDCSVDYLLGRTDNPEINRSAKKHTLAEYSEIAALGGSMTRDALIDDDFDTTLPEK